MIFTGAYDAVVLPTLYVSALITGYMMSSMTSSRKIDDMATYIDAKLMLISQLQSQKESLEARLFEKNAVIERTVQSLTGVLDESESESD